MNILVTGATGFIGRRLTAALSKTHFVRCLVRKSSDISVLKELSTQLVYGDLHDKNSIGPALDGIDLVYHLAGEVHSRRNHDYYNANVLATRNLLETCRRTVPPEVIFLSSIAVYKPVTAGNLLNEESECEPLTVYGRTKLAAEELFKKNDIPWVIVRAPIVYGPNQPAVLNRFFLDAFNKRKIIILGKGNNARSLCFIDNLVEGLILLAGKEDINKQIYIFSDHKSYMPDQMITTMASLMGQKINVVYLPNILGDISWQLYNLMSKLFNLSFIELYALKTMQLHWECDISKAKKKIGYNPNITLKMGIKSTMEWIKQNAV